MHLDAGLGPGGDGSGCGEVDVVGVRDDCQYSLDFAVGTGIGCWNAHVIDLTCLTLHSGGVEFGGECEPLEVGLDAARLRTAIEQVQTRRGAAQLCVIRDGRVVVDRWFGCEPDALFWLFSASRPYVAILVHQLVESGVLHLDDEVAAYWPAFAGEGKDGVTVRDVLRNQTSAVGAPRADARVMTDWAKSLRRIEEAPLRYPLSSLAFGFILAELVQRITRHPIQVVLQEAALRPLGVTDTHLGLPPELWGRQVPVKGSRLVNRRSTREAVVPGEGVSATARDLAALYQMLLNNGIGTAGRVLRPESVAAAVTPTSDPAFGQLRSPRVFGHNGSNCCVGWADPERQLAYAYLTDRLGRGPAEQAHHAAVADRILAAAG
ncbi:class A beta-lactamase-related serine hydrolase [Kribbella albertanoniae]|uniref:Class A beta-lactamase-related serine hydrolase n=1 Tax=Kribbella albertanoniae TaxID=1266829 RepID=A0A4R4PTK4_9ACTN|nr:class A beta-lactamase-related serine hydrolase [Kribbella albertanoniae]